MCTKTKNTYGCGHCAKIFEPCRIPGCNEVAKYKMPPRDADCAQCRSAGDTVTRGKDGKGRHAREIRSRRSSTDSFASSSPASAGIAHMAISPWAANEQSPINMKLWSKPTRRQADDAWVIEHERRMSDLDDKTSKLSLDSCRNSHQSSRRSSPHSSYERIVEASEVEEPEEIEPPRSPPKAIQMLPFEISEDSEVSRSHRRSRKTSCDSDHSSPYKTSPDPRTPRRKTRFVPAISEHDPVDSRQLVHRPRRHGPKTEPYHPHPQSCYFDSPVSGSPIIGGHWESHYQVVHPPLQHDAYYPRTYPVY